MAKFKLSSLLNGSSTSSTKSSKDTDSTAEAKKQNRRSFFQDSKQSQPQSEVKVTNGASQTTPVPLPATTPTDSPSRMAQLAQQIATSTAALEASLKELNLPLPSFDITADPDYASHLAP